MKKSTVLLLMLTPKMIFAFFGWSFNDLSFLAGQQYRHDHRPLWALELQYDRFNTSCTDSKKYFGYSVNYAFTDNHYETGIKAMWNPSNLIFPINNNNIIYPYLFGQANYSKTKTPIPNTDDYAISNDFIFRPGLGFTAYFLSQKALNLRTQLQFGYNLINGSSFNVRNNGTIELKIGIGFNL